MCVTFRMLSKTFIDDLFSAVKVLDFSGLKFLLVPYFATCLILVLYFFITCD